MRRRGVLRVSGDEKGRADGIAARRVTARGSNARVVDGSERAPPGLDDAFASARSVVVVVAAGHVDAPQLFGVHERLPRAGCEEEPRPVGGPARRAGSLGSRVRHLRHRPAPRGHRVDLLARVLLHGERDAGAVARDEGREDGSRSVRDSRGDTAADVAPPQVVLAHEDEDIAVEGGPAVVPLRRRSVIAGSARGHGVRLGRLLLRGRRRRRGFGTRAKRDRRTRAARAAVDVRRGGRAGRGRAAVGGRDAEWTRACDRGGALHSPETESRVSARAVVT